MAMSIGLYNVVPSCKWIMEALWFISIALHRFLCEMNLDPSQESIILEK